MNEPAPFNRPTRSASASPAAIAEAARLLAAGALVAFPTETVYGLGADASDAQAVAALYAAKNRPSFNPLIAHTADRESAERQGVFNAPARTLALAFWPGPLTLVVPVAPGSCVSALARAGLDTVALRVPAHPVARALLAAAARPIVAPSANLSGRVSPTAAEHVLADLSGRIDFVLDGGPTDVGVESTVLAALGDGQIRLLRPGGLAREAIEAALGRPLAGGAESDALRSPGMLASHYAPRAALRLNAVSLRPGEAALDFGGRLAGGAPRLDLSPSENLAEAAANLFAYLRALDAARPRLAAAITLRL
jgi:L-threonylcarbamoyladenylate synthase